MTSEIATILKGYFESIGQSFEETIISQDTADWVDTAGVVSLILFLLSTVPVLPLSFKYLIPWKLKSDAAAVWGHRLSLTSLGLWWAACAGVTFVSMVLLIRWGTTRKKRKEKSWLSEPQMRFALCYSIVENIKKYQTNGLTRHIENATLNWNKLMKMLVTMLRPYSFVLPTGMTVRSVEITEEPMWHRPGRMHLYAEIDALKERFQWFRVDPYTSITIEAFETFPMKTRDRLQDKKDLGAVASCLQNLSGYLYSRIPNVSLPTEKHR